MRRAYPDPRPSPHTRLLPPGPAADSGAATESGNPDTPVSNAGATSAGGRRRSPGCACCQVKLLRLLPAKSVAMLGVTSHAGYRLCMDEALWEVSSSACAAVPRSVGVRGGRPGSRLAALQEMNPTPIASHSGVQCILCGSFQFRAQHARPTNRCLCYFPFCISTKQSLQKQDRTFCLNFLTQ